MGRDASPPGPEACENANGEGKIVILVRPVPRTVPLGGPRCWDGDGDLVSVLNPGTAGTPGWLGVREAECQQAWARRGTNLLQLQVSSFCREAPRAEGSSVPRTLCSIFEQQIAPVPSVSSTWVCRQGKLALKPLSFFSPGVAFPLNTWKLHYGPVWFQHSFYF